MTLTPAPVSTAPAPVAVTNDNGDHERFSHIVSRDDQMLGYVMGKEITALCGKRWVPSRDPERFPVCPDCKRVLEERRRGTPPPD